MNQRKRTTFWAAAVAMALVVMNAPSLAAEEEEEEQPFCPGSQGGYKNSGEWPVESLFLGDHEYDEDALRDLLDARPRGDKSIPMARQLIAAELNAAAGHDTNVSVDEEGTTVADVMAAAHALVGNESLPANIRGDAGADWDNATAILDAFNNGAYTEGCFEEDEEPAIEPEAE